MSNAAFSNLDTFFYIDEYEVDPMINRKIAGKTIRRKFELYKTKLEDPHYMDFAINKIAMELTHFISK
ncbi:MAG: hypothetical protein H7A25_13225 [Leptospiraceae bacterium]|nr:hypothetical protein [Leptospiraceae bacterium]MCP5500862.1 hypothetical protein [Leptospiraceae bacterium]